MINKPKNNYKSTNTATNLAIIGAILWQLIAPTVVLAQFGQNNEQNDENNHILSQSQADRMFYPNIDKKPSKTLNAVITAYTSTPGQTDDDPFVAAWGERVYDGMIANNCLKHNTIVKIPAIYGDKVFRVSDRMNSRYGCERFDIWLDTSVSQARQFGVKRVAVEIYFPEKAPARLAVAK